MTTDRSAEVEHASHNGIIGGLVSFYAFFDVATVGLAIIALAAIFPFIVVLAIALVVLIILNTACCRWLDREWDSWYLRYGAKVEKRLAKMREGKLMRSRWRGSPANRSRESLGLLS